MKKDWYKELRKKYTDKEIAESFVLPLNLDPEEEAEMNEEMRALRMKMLREMTEKDRIFSDLMRLKLQMEDYTEEDAYAPAESFGHYLQEYLRIIGKTRKALAEDLSLHYSRLSRILNDKEEPNIEITYRLEKHSGELIPAVLWWKILAKRQEYLIRKDDDKRAEEAKKVKNAFQFRA